MLNPTYNISKSYNYNYQNGPIFTGQIPKDIPPKNKIKLFDFELNSPLGIPAGPLLNSNWIKLYANLGWDIPVYKTVRSIKRDCHPNPNCAYVETSKQLEPQDANNKITTLEKTPEHIKDIAITNSFGMPSAAPKEWMPDIERANSYLGKNQVMIVSIVGTPGEGKSLAADYARTAAMAKEAGAKIIEANYSCPNVCSGEGSIFTSGETSSEISKEIKKAIGNTPLLIKVGNFPSQQIHDEVVEKNAPFINGIMGINTIPMKVYDQNEKQALPGEGRLTSGICGSIIHNISQHFTQDLVELRKQKNYDFIIGGVGGITTPKDIDQRLAAGADIIMSATGAMWDPMMAVEWKRK